MPEFTIPTTPEQWADVEVMPQDDALHGEWCKGTEGTDAPKLAAASRLLERERCAQRVADQLAGGEGKSLDALPANERAVLVEAARRILEAE